MSGQPLGFESCFTAFVALIGGVAAGLVLLFIECFSKWTKFNIPWLDIYDKRASSVSTDLEEADEMAQKDTIILNLMAQNKVLKTKLNKMAQMKALTQPPWYMRSFK